MAMFYLIILTLLFLFFETKSHGIWAVVKLTICVQGWHELDPFASTSQAFSLYIGKYLGFLFFVVVEIQVLSHVRQVSYHWAISPVQLKFIYKIAVENWLWKYKAWTHKGKKPIYQGVQWKGQTQKIQSKVEKCHDLVSNHTRHEPEQESKCLSSSTYQSSRSTQGPLLMATIPQSYWWNEFLQQKYMSVIPAFRRLSQEDCHEFKANQGYKASSTNLGYIY